jgi:hypothetical protein
MIARLKDSVPLRQAAQDADRVARQIMHDFPRSMSAIHITFKGCATPQTRAQDSRERQSRQRCQKQSRQRSGYNPEQHVLSNATYANNIYQLIQVIREQFKQGADFIKTYQTGPDSVHDAKLTTPYQVHRG